MSKEIRVGCCPFCWHRNPFLIGFKQQQSRVNQQQVKEVQVICLECGSVGPLKKRRDAAMHLWLELLKKSK